MTKYYCPACNGTAVTWNMSARKAVCPKDNTPVSKFVRKE